MPDAAVQITVIVPVFNAATTVHRAASSVLDHTRASVELPLAKTPTKSPTNDAKD